MDLLHLLAFELRFTRETNLHFFHHAALYAALLDRLGNPKKFPPGVALYAPERGRVRYTAGEPYRFGVGLLAGGPISPAQLADLWKKPPKTKYGKMPGAPFGDNFRVELVTDLVARRPLGRARPAILTSEALDKAAQSLAKETEVEIRFLSPLLILRKPVERKDTVMDGDVFLPAVFLERAAQAVQEWWGESAITENLPDPPRQGRQHEDSPLTGVVELVENRMVRTDLSYPKKRLLGSAGSVKLRFKDGVGQWAMPLLLAGIIGAGKATNMGQGRFELVGHPLPRDWPPRPARTILERAADAQNLAIARSEIAGAGPTPGVDGESKSDFLDGLTIQMPRIAGKLRSGKVKPSSFRGLLVRSICSDTGREKLRPLSIPTLEDRFCQRAVFQELAPAVEQLLEDASFAYRKGLSHRTAIRSVSKARKEGFTHVLDADIRSFFDEVEWNRLEIRLHAYFGDDPVADVLMDWVRAPVEFEGRTLTRNGGLPQGAVVSPILANLFLDGLDEALSARGFRLVRYADDFVVLCRSAKEAERAHKAAEEELKKLGLALHAGKTREAAFDEGFRFLGALFCRSMVLETNRDTAQKQKTVMDSLPRSVSGSDVPVDVRGWLNDFLAQAAETPNEEKKPEPPRFRAPHPPPSRNKRPIYIITRGTRLRGRRQGLIIEQDGARPKLVAWNELSEIVVLGGAYVATSVIQRAMRQRVPVAFHKWDGAPLGLVLPDRVRSPSETTLNQWEWAKQPGRRLDTARNLIAAKIRNVRLSVRRRSDVSGLLPILRSAVLEAERSEDNDRLRGVEGQAAHAYFSHWDGWINNRLGGFPGRTSRGAADPVNCMLNLLYTQLFRLTHTTILAAGLDPYLGVLHDGKGRYASLAADLMEPFRFLVDRIVLEVVNHDRVSDTDFRRMEKGPYPLRIETGAVRLLIGRFEELLACEVADADDRIDTYRGHLFRQAMSLGRVVAGQDEKLISFRMKW